MLQTYTVLIKRNSDNKIASYFYPDFNFEYTYVENTRTLLDDVTEVLARHIRNISKDQVIPFSRQLSYYEKSIKIHLNDHLQLCHVNISSVIGKSEKYLPSFGIFSSVTSALTMAIINFYTIKESIDSSSATGIGSTGAILSALMVIIMYYFSEANDISRRIGRRIDNLFTRKTSPRGHNPNEKLYSLTFVFKILLTLVPVISTIFGSYSHYNQVISIVDSKDDSDIFAEVFKYLSIIMILSGGYSKLIFQLSFLPPAYDKIDEYLPRLSSGLIRFFNQHDPVVDDEAIVLIDVPENVADKEDFESNDSFRKN